MGCLRGTNDSPTWGFFPTKCGGQTPNFISRTAPRAQFIFFCRDRRPRLSALCVGISVCARISFHAVGDGGLLRFGHARGLTVIQTVIQDPRAASLPSTSRKSAQSPLCAQSPFPSRNGFYKLFLSQKEKVTKRSWRACRSTASAASVRVPTLKLPSEKIPTSPHARIFGANGVPQRGQRFPHLGIFPHRLRRAEPEFYLALCAPRAIYFLL